jgi:hypothetical protein
MMRDAQMNAWRNWANRRNTYDDAYVMGYHNGYHAVKYDNQYDPEEHSKYHIKFKMGYTEGKLLRVKEEAGL